MSHGQGLWERGLVDRRPTMPVATYGQRKGDLEAGRLVALNRLVATEHLRL